MKKVNKNTRAGTFGRIIVCPFCNKSTLVHHFGWTALGCRAERYGGCGRMVQKADWFVAEKVSKEFEGE